MTDDLSTQLSRDLARWADSTHRHTASEIQARPPQAKRPALALVAALVVFVVLVGALVAGLALRSETGTTVDTPTTTAPLPSAEIGQSAPGITGTASDGSEFSLDSLRGSRVVLELSATWCEPCQQRIAQLVEAADADPSLQIVIVAVDNADVAALEDAVRSAGASWPVVTLNDQSNASLGIQSVPKAFVIAPDGTVTEIQAGTGSIGELAAPTSTVP